MLFGVLLALGLVCAAGATWLASVAYASHHESAAGDRLGAVLDESNWALMHHDTDGATRVLWHFYDEYGDTRAGELVRKRLVRQE